MFIQMVTITLGMPIGSMVTMESSEYNSNIKVTAFWIALSTVLLMIIIPLILLLLRI